MGKKVYFLDSIEQSDGNYDNTYGVDDLNGIVKNLVGAGIAPFQSSDAYNVSELNAMTEALVSEGASLDGLRVTFANNTIHIAEGIGFFENGASIVVDRDGEELEYNVAETLYVYAEYNLALNTCGFYTSENYPTPSEGVYILVLAAISADGNVTDLRTVAQSKVATLGKNVFKRIELFDFTDSDERNVYGYGATIWKSDFDLSKFNAINISGKSQLKPYDINFFVYIKDIPQYPNGVQVYQPGGEAIFMYVSLKNGNVELYAYWPKASDADILYLQRLEINVV